MASGSVQEPGFLGSDIGSYKGSSVYSGLILGDQVGTVKDGHIYSSGLLCGDLIATYSGGTICKPGFLGETIATYGDGKVCKAGLFGETVATYSGPDEPGGPAAALLTILACKNEKVARDVGLKGAFYTAPSSFWGSREQLGTFKNGKIFAMRGGLLEGIFGPSEVVGHYRDGKVRIGGSVVGQCRDGVLYAADYSFWRGLFGDNEILGYFVDGKILAPRDGWLAPREVLGTYEGSDEGGAAAAIVLLSLTVRLNAEEIGIEKAIEPHPAPEIRQPRRQEPIVSTGTATAWAQSSRPRRVRASQTGFDRRTLIAFSVGTAGIVLGWLMLV